MQSKVSGFYYTLHVFILKAMYQKIKTFCKQQTFTYFHETAILAYMCLTSVFNLAKSRKGKHTVTVQFSHRRGIWSFFCFMVKRHL